VPASWCHGKLKGKLANYYSWEGVPSLCVSILMIQRDHEIGEKEIK
jgi:hypothetical protein